MGAITRILVLKSSMRALALIALVLVPGHASAGSLPSQVGACAVNTIRSIGAHKDGRGHVPNPVSGTEVILADGFYSAPYEGFHAVVRSRVGNPSGNASCPSLATARPGRLYAFINLRIRESRKMKDTARGFGGD